MTARATTDVIHDDFTIEEPKKSSKKGLWTILLLILVLVVGFVLIKDPFGQTAKDGDTVVVSYIARYNNGEIYEQKTLENPLSFVLGEGQVVSGLEEEVLGMRVDATKSFVLTPEEGSAKYYDPSKKQILPGILFDQIGEDAIVGNYYDLGNVKGAIIAIKGEGTSKQIVLDTNLLETRQDLNYELKLLEIIK